MDGIILWPKFAQTLDEANEYTDTAIGELAEGLTYKGSVATVSALPASGNEAGDCYNVTDGSGMYAWNGTSWGSASKTGPQGATGTAAGFGAPTASAESVEYGESASASVTASGPDTAKIFNFNFEIPKGFSPVANVSKSGKKATITITDTTGTTTAEVSDGANSVSVSNTGTSTSKVKYITIDGTESKMGVDVEDSVSSTSTENALSAHMGKELQDQISNLKNIGRFLAIWNSVTGLPLTNPTTMPYTYKTGDYYRVGTVASGSANNYKPNGASYTGTASSTVETEDVEIGWVYYYDGDEWLAQSAGGGGLVQDVQVNGVTVLDLNSGVANITDEALADVKYTSQTLTTAQQLQARTNIGASAPTVIEFM